MTSITPGAPAPRPRTPPAPAPAPTPRPTPTPRKVPHPPSRRTHRPVNLPPFVRPLLLSLLLPASCTRTVHLGTVEVTPNVGSEPQVRSATNLPTAFTVVTPAQYPGDCPPRLADPPLGATLRLRRAVLLQAADSTARRAVGDYVLDPQDLYGARPGDLLRVDCSRLTALGLVDGRS